MKYVKPSAFRNVTWKDGFWTRFDELVRRNVIPYQYRALNDLVEDAEPSHSIENFRIAAGESDGEFDGRVFQDSDTAKWLEAVGYSLMKHPDPDLEAKADEIIRIIAKAQLPDGYLDSYFTIKEPDKKWTNLRDWHEMYCAGHMMEAAVAYYEATGKRVLLDTMLRMAKHIYDRFGPVEEGKIPGYPGHEEIELALVKMYGLTGEKWLLDLAAFFVKERGKSPNFFEEEAKKRGDTGESRRRWGLDLSYWQAHAPVTEQKTMEGHSVRALYFLSGVADVARLTEDEVLKDACRTLFDDCVNRRMYVTGGVGSTHVGEAFSFDYDLPNDTIYAETCASIALVFAAQRMLQMEPLGWYADAMERALYNTCIAGMDLEGRRFFYVNPLEVLPEASKKDPGKRHVLPVRPRWFGCACCPPNLARLLASLGNYFYGVRGRDVYAYLYDSSVSELETENGPVTLDVTTRYPLDGQIAFRLSKGDYDLNLRIPSWSRDCWCVTKNGVKAEAEVKDGFAKVCGPFEDGDTVVLTLDLSVQRVYASLRVTEDIGKVCLQKGPIVYCLEEADNGKNLQRIYLPREAEISAEFRPELLEGVEVLKTEALELADDGSDVLYRRDCGPSFRKRELQFIPYYAWANRGEGEMTVYVREKI